MIQGRLAEDLPDQQFDGRRVLAQCKCEFLRRDATAKQLGQTVGFGEFLRKGVKEITARGCFAGAQHDTSPQAIPPPGWVSRGSTPARASELLPTPLMAHTNTKVAAEGSMSCLALLIAAARASAK